MKHIYFLFLFISTFSFGQLIPPTELQSYYSSVDFSLVQTQLFDDLAVETATKHTNYISYTPGVWEASKITDEDPANNANVLLIYGYNNTDGNYVTDRTRSKNLNGGDAGTDWNREHTFPNSLAQPSLNSNGTNVPPYADAHNLRPSDVTMNSNRGNKKYATGSGNAGIVGSGNWYPGDEWKGDAARIIMYMYLRYGTQCLPSYTSVGTTNTIDSNMIDLLLQWNAEDPVSAYEDSRNTYHGGTGTYAQGNRNPFIDNPYIATVIWGGPEAEDRWSGNTNTDTEAPSAPTNLVASSPTSNSIGLSWTASTDNVGVASYDIYLDDVNTYNTSLTNFTATDLSSEIYYCFTVFAKDSAGNTSTVSNTACETTTAPSSGGTDLFFSEYVEGSGFNKALEIANITGSGVDLSIYSIKRNGNGGTTWEGPLNLSGTIAADDVYVIINTSTTNATLIAEADLSIPNSTPMTFNGNDPVGLFKNDVLIDIIGEFNSGSANFASNVTLRRKSSISSPTIQFELNDEWDSYASNTVSDIGMHTNTLSRKSEALNAIRLYPNPIKGNLLYINAISEASIEIFNVLGKRVIKAQLRNPGYYIDISTLNKGIYLVKIKSRSGTITKKLIRQ